MFLSKNCLEYLSKNQVGLRLLTTTCIIHNWSLNNILEIVAPNLVDSYGQPKNWFGAVMETQRIFSGEAICLDNSQETDFHKKEIITKRSGN